MTTPTQATGEQQADDHGSHSFEDCGYDRSKPCGLARLDAAGLAELRAIILRVIDDGSPLRIVKRIGGPRVWAFFDEDESIADAERLRFCDAIQAAVVAAAAPATQAKGER